MYTVHMFKYKGGYKSMDQINKLLKNDEVCDHNYYCIINNYCMFQKWKSYL